MKKMRSLIVLMIVLCIAMSMMVACRPAGEDDDDIMSNNNPTANNGDNPGGSEGVLDDDGDNNPSNSTNTNTPGSNNSNTPGNNNSNTPGNNNNNNSNTPGNNNNNTNNNTPGNNTSDIISNPLMKEGKKYNNNAAVSFDLDKTGFCKKGTLADLKGKTLTLFTGVDYGMFSYYNSSNKYLNEWDWFKELKRTYGVTIKYIRCSPGGSNVVKPFQAMSAGKDCDLITTHVASFPYICNILAPLDDYCNFSKLENSPGLDPQSTQLTRWKGKNIVLGPCLDNGCFNYNATFVKNAGLEDPYDLWKKGEWNWTNFKKYMTGLPDTTAQGKVVYGCATWSQYWYWANTNGVPCFAINGDDPNGGIVNNWDSAEVKETYVWMEGVMDAGGNYYSGSGGEFFWNTHKTHYLVMNYGTCGVDVVGILEEENKTNDYRWCPFPKNEKNSKAVNHVEVYGRCIGIPRKTNKEQNRIAAVKFCELWCNRYTEARFDAMITRSKMSYAEVKEFYDFCKTNGRMGMGSGVGKLASFAGSGANGTDFNMSITDAGKSVATSMAKLSNYAKQEVANVLKFGIQ